jgi:6-phosphogluconate dehydrogenase
MAPRSRVTCTASEGLGVLRAANRSTDDETAPLRDPGHDQFDPNLRDIARGRATRSVIASWWLDSMAEVLTQDPLLRRLAGRVSDSGEGLGSIQAERFSSRGEADFANALLSAMRCEGGRRDSMA